MLNRVVVTESLAWLVVETGTLAWLPGIGLASRVAVDWSCDCNR
jgi:hypothetical protein